MMRSPSVPLPAPVCSPGSLTRIARVVAAFGQALSTLPALSTRAAVSAVSVSTTLLLASTAHAQGVVPGAAQVAGSGGLRITPTLELNADVVNNSLAGSAGYENTQSGDLTLRVRPGLLMSGRLGRTSLNLNYALDFRQHSRPLPGQAETDRYRNYLNATLSSEVVERLVYVDAAASITQQTVLAYGQQSVDDQGYNPNRTEVAQFSVRPYSRGSLGGYALYDLSLNADTTQIKGTVSPDSRSTGASFALSSPSATARLGWSVQLSQQSARFSGGQTSDNSRISLSLKLRPDVDVQGTLRGGYEGVKIPGVYDAWYSNYGGDLRWTPSLRTTALISVDQRYFGRSYQLQLEHRMQRASFRLNSTRGVSTNANNNGVGTAITLYDLFYIQFASLQPDPDLRKQLVLDFLDSIGRKPFEVVSGGYVNAATTLQRREDFGMTYAGQRATLVVQAYNSRVGGLENTGAPGTSPTRQYGLSTSVSYRLTPERNATLSSNWLRTLSNGDQAGNRVRSVNLNLSERLSRSLTASVGARYSLFEGPTNPYHETSLGASLSLRF